MKPWQFQFDVIKREMIYPQSRKYLLSWKRISEPVVCDDEFLDFFKKTDETGRSVVYQSEDGAGVCIECAGAAVRRIFCVIDARSVDVETLEVMCGFMADNDAFILVDGRFYKPEAEQLYTLVKTSAAGRFAENPARYLGRHYKD